MANFINKCLSGDALLDEIDEYIERWHEGDGADNELHEYLGMTWGEYTFWSTRPSVLPYIIAARKKKIAFENEIEEEAHKLAARAANSIEANKTMRWLRSLGKI